MEQLTAEEARVLGCLIEKERTTPEYYPLSINALMAAEIPHKLEQSSGAVMVPAGRVHADASQGGPSTP